MFAQIIAKQPETYKKKNESLSVCLLTSKTQPKSLVFLLTGDTKAPQTQHDDSVVGLALMALYLFSDGFTSTLQEKLFAGYSMSKENQMIYVNGSSALLSIITLVASGQLW